MLSYIEISKQNLLHNFHVLKGVLNSQIQIISVIKANAYGHGDEEVVSLLDKETDYFAVDDIEELRRIRKVTDKPVLVLGYVAEADISEAILLDGILGIYDVRRAHFIDNIGQEKKSKIRVHVKIDASLGRQGVMVEEVQLFVNKISKLKNLEIEGIYAHFANIEDTSDFSHAQLQIKEFSKAYDTCIANGIKPRKHISATSGILAYEQHKGTSDFVRLGIGLYGMWPSLELQKEYETSNFFLKPVMRWVSHVAQVKTIPKGYSVGYGLTYIAKKTMKVAIVPQGYSDGYDRLLSNKGQVLIGGKRCDVIGRVAMNMFVVDVDHLKNVKVEDEVVLLGKQGEEQISAEEIANKIDTINYEVTTRIFSRIPRVIV